jgi:uncharacterized membrane protein YciS (DUF1049 family)
VVLIICGFFHTKLGLGHNLLVAGANRRLASFVATLVDVTGLIICFTITLFIFQRMRVQ